MGLIKSGLVVVGIAFGAAAVAKGGWETVFGPDDPNKGEFGEFVSYTLDAGGNILYIVGDKVVGFAQDPATQDAVASGTRRVIDGAENVGIGVLRGITEESREP